MNGGGKIARLKDVWFPNLFLTFLSLTAFKFLLSIGDIDKINLLTSGGGPNGSTRVFSIWLAQRYFQYGDYGYSAAAAFIMYLVVIIFLTIGLNTLRKFMTNNGIL